jgi:radical SAM enzyme (TIGR01210 family)
MCDLWKHTLSRPTPRGAIPNQIQTALTELRSAPSGSAEWDRRIQPGTGFGSSAIKLYNSGSFFDAGAIPPADHPEIARLLRGFDRVTVECHPALIGNGCLRFQGLLSKGRGQGPALEVAMGLETVHPTALERLNKRMTLDQFRQAADHLRRHKIGLRVFVLVRPPFLNEAEAGIWAQRSVAFAFECGATAVSLIPTRAGNGALDALSRAGEFRPPQLATVESVAAYGLGLHAGRVFVDLWEFDHVRACPHCTAARRDRLHAMNASQMILPPVPCDFCGGHPV